MSGSVMSSGKPVDRPDLIIIPGSKNTIDDLYFWRRSGLAARIADLSKSAPRYRYLRRIQMLGNELNDPLHAESAISHIEDSSC